MKLTNADIQNLAAAIVQAGRDGDKPRNLPWRVAYALARTSESLKQHLVAIEAADKAIRDKHANGRQFIKPGERGHAEIIKDLSDLNAAEVEVTVHKFKEADIEGTSMAPVVLVALLPLIED